MTLGAVSLDREGRLAVMASATGFALCHISHGQPLAPTIGEGLGMTIGAFVCCGVEVMAEVTDYGAATAFKGQVGWFITNVTLVAVTG